MKNLKGLFEKLEGRGQESSRREKRMKKKRWLLAPNRRSKCVHTLPIHGGTIKTNRYCPGTIFLATRISHTCCLKTVDVIQATPRDPLEVLVGPMTRFRVKRFKNAFDRLLQYT
jgi:hypothetical protein